MVSYDHSESLPCDYDGFEEDKCDFGNCFEDDIGATSEESGAYILSLDMLFDQFRHPFLAPIVE